MGVKRRDFQKAVNFLQEFLMKLTEQHESAELRDSLNMCLLHMQKYYKTLKSRTQEQMRDHVSLSSSLSRGLSPMTPFRDAPDRFQWIWVNLKNPSVATLTKSLSSSEEFSNIPPILQATKLGDLSTVNRIVAQDGPECLSEVDGLGRNCVMYAVHYRQQDLLRLFLQHHCDVNTLAHDDSTALHRACHDGNAAAVEMLLQHGARSAAVDAEGRTPLHWAATNADSLCLTALLSQGVSVSPRDNEGMTPAMWACRMDCQDTFEKLRVASAATRPTTETGSEELEVDNMGRTWLHWAIRKTEPLHCLSNMLTPESNQVVDNEGKSPIHVAAEQGALAACRLILDVCGVDAVNCRDNANHTPLHVATICGHGEIVNLFCEKGADTEAVDGSNATAWNYAVNRQLHYCMLILQYYRQQESHDLNSKDPMSMSMIAGVGPGKPPFISPRPPNFPQSRGSTPNTPRSRIISSRPSTKRSSIAASINGSISPPPEEDRGLSTYRSSNGSLQGPVYPQKKQKPNSPRDADAPAANREAKGVGLDLEVKGVGVQHSHEFKSPPIPAQNTLPVHKVDADFQNRLVLNGEAEQEFLGMEDDQQNEEFPQEHPDMGYEGEPEMRPESPMGSDMTDVSVPVNVSDIDDHDPPTVIHNAPRPNTPPQVTSPKAAPRQLISTNLQVSISAQDNAHTRQSRPRERQSGGAPIMYAKTQQPITAKLQPNLQRSPQGSASASPPQVVGARAKPAASQDMHVNKQKNSPSRTVQHLSPDSSLSLSVSSKTGMHAGSGSGAGPGVGGTGGYKPSRRPQSQSPVKAQSNPKLEEIAALKEQQLADMHFTPLHRRSSPGGHLEPLGNRLPAPHSAHPGQDTTAKRERKKKRATDKNALPRTGKLEPLEGAIQGSAYPIHQSAKRRDQTGALESIDSQRKRAQSHHVTPQATREEGAFGENRGANHLDPLLPIKKQPISRKVNPLALRQNSGMVSNRGRSYPGNKILAAQPKNEQVSEEIAEDSTK